MDFNGIIDILLNTGLWKLIATTIGALVIKDILQNVSKSIGQYILFKTDMVGVGTKIEYNKEIGVVRDFNVRRITIDFIKPDGGTVRRFIPSQESRKMVIIEIIKNNETKED